MRNLWLVTEFTIKEMIKRKSFIISTLVLLIIIATAFNIPNIMKMLGKNDFNEEILVIDPENLFEGNVEVLNQMNMGYNFEITTENLNYDQLKQKIENDKDECIKFTKNEETIKMEYIVESATMNFGTVPQELVSIFTNLYSKIQISKLNITPEELATIEPEFDVVLVETDENAAKGNVTIMMIISLVLFYAVFFCAQQVSVAITTEKTSKIMETLVTSTTPKTIVLGKTIGIGIVGLIQVAAMIIVSIISANLFLEEGMLETVLDMSNITPALAILTLVYFILGYALYALLYALTGSTVSKPEDINSANGPVAVLAVIGFYLAYFSMMNPTSDINVFASIFPLSASFSMPFRIMMGTATTMQIIGSIAILILSIIIIANISIKIYSSAILNYGTKLSLKDMLNIYKDKNN